jgi:hypothetical protein
MSFNKLTSIPGLGQIDDFDIVRFDATSWGNATAGSFSLYFDGSVVGLDSGREDIDALSLLSDGRIIVSTTGSFSVPGLSGKDEDLIAFTPTSLGAATSGTWAMFFDGSDVGLDSQSEDINGMYVAFDGNVYLSTTGNFSVTGASGMDEDVFYCQSITAGNNTTCTYVSNLYFDGSDWGLGGEDIDAIGLP